MRMVLLWVSNGLILLGLAILLATGAVYGYSLYEQAQAEREVASLAPAVPDAWTPVPPPTATPTKVPLPAVAGPRADSFVPWPDRRRASPVPTPSPTRPAILPAERIEAPAIHLDAKVVESPIVNGEWEIPKFAAGHLEGSAQPLQGSNVILAGHVQSISSGDVFANLDRLKPGDLIRLYTKVTVVTYRVSKVETVANDDVKVLAPTPREELTLITCTGEWLPFQHDYSERTVVIADRVPS